MEPINANHSTRCRNEGEQEGTAEKESSKLRRLDHSQAGPSRISRQNGSGCDQRGIQRLRAYSDEKNEANVGGRRCETWGGDRERYSRKRACDEDRRDSFKRARYEEARGDGRDRLPGRTESASWISGPKRAEHTQDLPAGMGDRWLVSDIMIHLSRRVRSRHDLKSWENQYYEKMDNLLFHVEDTIKCREDGCPLGFVRFQAGSKPDQAFISLQKLIYVLDKFLLIGDEARHYRAGNPRNLRERSKKALEDTLRFLHKENQLVTYGSAIGVSLLASSLTHQLPRFAQHAFPLLEAIAAHVNCKEGSALLEGASAHSLAILANVFSKYIADKHFCRALKKIADQVAGNPLPIFKARDIATLANAFSKHLDDPDTRCRQALVKIADYMINNGSRTDLLNQMNTQDLANLANAFCKHLDDKNGFCLQALEKIAHHVARDSAPGLLASANAQEIAVLANAFSKHLKGCNPLCQQALIKIARHLVNDTTSPGLLTQANAQQIAVLANAFSKHHTDHDALCHKALVKIARHLVNDTTCPGLLAQSSAQGIANLANAFSKHLTDHDTLCRQALEKTAGFLVNDTTRADFLEGANVQEIANLANAFSKHLTDHDTLCRRALEKIAGFLVGGGAESGLLARANGQDLSNLANAFSKHLTDHDTLCRRALEKIAGFLVSGAAEPGLLARTNAQGIANLANAFSKHLTDRDRLCRRALEKIAGFLVSGGAESDLLARANAQGLSNLANAFSKHLTDHDTLCRQALEKIAGFLVNDTCQPDLLAQAKAQETATLANAFSKHLADEKGLCPQALIKTARYVLDNPLSELNSQDMSTLANAFSKHLTDEKNPCQQAMIKMAHHVLDHPLSELNEQSTANLANAFARLPDAPPCRPAVDRLLRHIEKHHDTLSIITGSQLLKAAYATECIDRMPKVFKKVRAAFNHHLKSDPSFKADNLETTLETLGNLCWSLMALIRMRRFLSCKGVTNMLDTLCPVLKEKLGTSSLTTRYPAVTVYQILKTYLAYRDQADARQQRANAQHHEAWVRQVFKEHQHLFDDLSSYSWNTIARLEADDPDSALDDFITAHLSRVTQKEPAAKFSLDTVFNEMAHAPVCPLARQRSESGLPGLAVLRSFSVSGAPRGEASEFYTIFNRLTQGRIPVHRVKLPGQPSACMLSKMVSIEGRPCRIDLFGGSSMKAERLTVAQIMNQADDSKRGQRDFGSLYAVPAADTTQDSDLTRQLMARLFTYQESFYYFQRAMMASVSPRNVLEGEFNVAVIADRPMAHPFKIVQNGQFVSLQPHDGFGFIRRSAAAALPAFADIPQVFGNQKRGRLPAQALQHYPRDRQVVRETLHGLGGRLADPALTGEDRFYHVITGGITGELALAVPVADERLYLPASRIRRGQDRFDRFEPPDIETGVLIGRSPYDKANLRPMGAGRIGRAGSDSTADFLSTLSLLQYTLVGQEQSEDRPLTFFKGLLGVLDDALWPAPYVGQHIVFSAEDQKMHTHWTTAKHKVPDQQITTLRGILAAKEIFGPGSAVGVPIEEQKKLDGDFDGDPVLVITDRPRLWELVARHDARPVDARHFALKPAKTFTPAQQGGDKTYKYGRSGRILATKAQVLESFVTLQNVFLALDPQTCEKIAGKIMAAMITLNMVMVEDVPPDTAGQVMLVGDMLSRGIKVGTDAYKSDTDTYLYAELAKHIRIILQSRHIPLSVPYGKSFARHLAGAGPAPDLIAQKREQLRSNATLAAAIMEQTLTMLPAPAPAPDAVAPAQDAPALK